MNIVKMNTSLLRHGLTKYFFNHVLINFILNFLHSNQTKGIFIDNLINNYTNHSFVFNFLAIFLIKNPQ